MRGVSLVIAAALTLGLIGVASASAMSQRATLRLTAPKVVHPKWRLIWGLSRSPWKFGDGAPGVLVTE